MMARHKYWTLVQHSGNHKPGFAHAVEEAPVTTPADVERVRNAGGLLLESYSEAAKREYAENYPGDLTLNTIYPKVRGTFSRTRLDGFRIYIPASEPHIVSMEGPTPENDPVGRFTTLLNDFTALSKKGHQS